MGRAIDQENRIDVLNARIDTLGKYVSSLQDAVERLLGLALASEGGSYGAKKKTTKKKTKSSDGAKDSISNK